MADRKIDYFGTFLENMKQSGPEAEPRQKAARRAFPGSDRLNEVLKSLRGGPRGAKDLLPLTGNSITEFLAIRD